VLANRSHPDFRTTHKIKDCSFAKVVRELPVHYLLSFSSEINFNRQFILYIQIEKEFNLFITKLSWHVIVIII
jgi:hypothetical protein